MDETERQRAARGGGAKGTSGKAATSVSRKATAPREDESAPLLQRDDAGPEQSCDSSNAEQVSEASWSVHVRHSRAYVAWTVLQIVILTVLMAWVALDRSALRNWLFLLLEFIVTVAVLFDAFLQVHFQGPRRFFLGCISPERPELGIDGEQVIDRARLRTAAMVVLNYMQLALTMLCIVGFLITIQAGRNNWEEEVSLALLLLRYVALIVFFLLNQVRSASLQGGTLRSCGMGKEVDEEWDVKFSS
mmetsp:Transcript_9090/g.23133  ORF Transcript_9090/g.23133 Transcript_9090/m.23133 type:complete len:247 (+) Transcript_9090:125-865(+)